MKGERIWLLLLMIAGFLLRLDLLWASNWVIDADEAIVGLMAQRLVEGRSSEIPVFYYGQPYMGSLEPLMLAAVFWVLGLFGVVGHTDSVVLLKLVPLSWSIALIPLVHQLGKRIGGAFCGLIAAAYIALPPSPLVVWSSMARGGFIEVVVMAAAALLLAVRWAEEGKGLRLTAAIGLVLGLGWWTNNQIIYAILPIGLWMLVNMWRGVAWPVFPIIKQLLVGTSAFIIGGLPFWWYNIENDFVSFAMFGGASGGKISAQVSELFTVALPIIFGAKRFWHVGDVFPGATILVWSVVGIAVLLGVILFRPAGSRISLLRIQYPHELIIVYALTTCAVFSLSSFGWLTSAPRYLLPIYPAIAVLVGLVISIIARVSVPMATACIAVVLSFNLVSVYLGGRAIPGQPVVAYGERVAQSHEELISWLQQRGVAMVETNYWIGYRLAYETNEAVRFRVFGEPATVRIPEYEAAAAVTAEAQIPLILVPSQLASVGAALTALGETFKSERVGSYSVITERVSRLAGLREIEKSKFTADASVQASAVDWAFDGDLRTRWSSAAAQTPNLEFRVRFSEAVHLKGLLLDWRDFPPDYPRGLEIVVSSQASNGTQVDTVVFTAEQYRKAQPLCSKVRRLTVAFDVPGATAIVLRQLGSDRKFDWTIAEMKLYE